MLCRIKDLIFKDVKSENETKKVAVILRINSLFMCLYFLCLTIAFGITGSEHSDWFSLLCFLVYIVICYITYRDNTRYAAGLMQISMMVWVVYFVWQYGWGCGVQHFIFVMLVLDFTTLNSNIKQKIAMGAAAFAGRLLLYIYTNMNAPIHNLLDSTSVAFQIINSLFIFISLTATMIVFTENSQEMEQKLVVYNEKLHKLASIDALTQLLNRRSMQEYLDIKEEEGRQGRIECLSIAIGDIDFFKKINDTYSHECGDEVLRRLSQLFTEVAGDRGKIGRWGGEEFLFVFANMNGDEAGVILNELQKRIVKLQIPYSDHIIKVTMTFGLSEFDFHRGMDCTIHDADEKLYQGKMSGRNKIVY